MWDAQFLLCHICKFVVCKFAAVSKILYAQSWAYEYWYSSLHSDKNGSSNKIVWLTVFGSFYKTFWLSRPNFFSVDQSFCLIRFLVSTKYFINWTKCFGWIYQIISRQHFITEKNVEVTTRTTTYSSKFSMSLFTCTLFAHIDQVN